MLKFNSTCQKIIILDFPNMSVVIIYGNLTKKITRYNNYCAQSTDVFLLCFVLVPSIISFKKSIAILGCIHYKRKTFQTGVETIYKLLN
jgi:hypothetical protein